MLPIRELSAVANSPYLADYLRVLERLSSDRWFSRAWITQERLSASVNAGSQILWITCGLNHGWSGAEVRSDAQQVRSDVKALLEVLKGHDPESTARLEKALHQFDLALKIPTHSL